MKKPGVFSQIKDFKKKVGTANSVPILIGGAGLGYGLYKFITGFLYAPVNHLSGTAYTFYSTAFLIQLFCIPTAIIFSLAILLGSQRVYRHFALSKKKSLVCISYSFLLFAVPLLTSIASDKISSFYLGPAACLLLYIWINILAVLFLWLEKKSAGVRFEDCLEISLVITLAAWFVLRYHIYQLDNFLPFRYLVIFFPLVMNLGVFLTAVVLSRRFKKTLLDALGTSCSLFLIFFLYYVLSYFFSTGFNLFIFLAYILTTSLIFLFWRQKRPMKPERLMNYLNKTVYLVIATANQIPGF